MTPLWSPGDLAAATDGRMTRAFFANGVSIDSRTVAAGDLFVALADQRDGHDFVADALGRGAAGALVSRIPDGLREDASLLVVDDTLRGLTALGAFARHRFRGQVIAVTGSVGKTTTKEMLRAILASAGMCWAAEASHNNHWGVPLTLARLPAQADFCVVEIGMNHAGEIAPLARLAAPRVAMVVSVEPAHIGHLGSIEAIADEKASIYGGLPADGIAVVPGDLAVSARFTPFIGNHRTIDFGAGEDRWARLVSADVDAEGTSVRAVIGGKAVAFRMAAPGWHMAMNAVAAIAGASALGIAPAQAGSALNGFAPVAGRGARRDIRLPGGGGAVLLDESYNASSASIRAALAVLSVQPCRRRMAVLGDMRELGDHGPAEHIGLESDVRSHADILYSCGPLMKLLSDALPPQFRGAHTEDSETLAPIVASAIRPGDAVLVKGSLGSRMRHVVAAIERLGASG